uniref:PHD-type domain-containing protein n=1 Tax=Aegilops tauschii subsp. strangulata TaxID=200361 RepID=A0A453I9C7_AEGTS
MLIFLLLAQVYQPTEEEIRRWLDPYENLMCIECNQGGEDSLMLLCDICDSSAHTYCVGLGREVPEGNWYCGGCRLSGEGSTHPRSLTNSNSAQLGMTVPISTFGRSLSINTWQTFQGFDLNASPREIPRQNIHADSRASTLGVSTPTGRLATLSRRREWMHILLDRQRLVISQDTGHDGVQHSGYAPRADPDHRNFCASSGSNSLQHNDSLPRIEPNRRNFSSPWEANSSQTLLDDIRDQHGCFSSVQAQRNSTPCLFADGNNFQQTESVNSNVKHMCSISPH